ncbi:protein of unknown function [Candidatus Methylocalor cossyra]|uniref:Resolvase/invertase-type recombinase catalytic domain-containing protein n=1 Tax=Candidatus Methylocalor cossyra TaxID=3108543 RepID=A0ABP1C6F9_9GAMM
MRSKGGTRVHESTFYKILADVEAAGIKAVRVDASLSR